MIDLANLIHLVPVECVSSLNRSEVALKAGYSFDLFLTENDVKVGETTENKDSGECFTASTKIIVDTMTDLQRRKYARNRKVIAMLVKTTGEKLVWGTLDYPVTCSIIPLINTFQISLQSKAIESVF